MQTGSGLILREREPLNLESPFESLDGLVTPNNLHYVRNHFKVPPLDAGALQLKVDGAVKCPFSLTYDEIRALPTTTRTVTLECAGNGRVFLVPQKDGAQWGLGAVSTARWTGVALEMLLDRASLMDNAREIVFEAADSGMPKEKPLPPAEIHYARSIALADAHNVLLAYSMNGEPIPPDHGFPLRAIIPGHYAMASVKWLMHIRVVDQPFTGYWQTSDYAYWEMLGQNPVRRPLSAMPLKSSIARPRMHEEIAAGTEYRVVGAAWCGCGAPASIEFSDDDGQSWHPASFLDPPEPAVWRRWEFHWQVGASKGRRILKSRARDSSGDSQPDRHDSRFGSYAVHYTVGIEVFIV